MKTLIIGIGNPILGDDGIGIQIVQQLKEKITRKNIFFDEAMTGGMNLLDLIKGFDKAILVDTIYDMKSSFGSVKRFTIDESSTVHSCNPHDVSLPEAITLAKKLGEQQIPKDIIIIGIVLHETPCEFTEKISPEIKQAIPTATNMILTEINEPNHGE